MIQLFINGKQCDIDDDVKIRLDKSFDNETEHVIEESEYSFEIDLPVTRNNREVFGFVDVFDVAAKFNQSYDAILNVDETKVLVGKFIMDSIDADVYSVNLYVPGKKSLKDVLGDKKMKDIKEHPVDLSTWEAINKVQQNVISGASLSDMHICFPYILYRLPYNVKESPYEITVQDLSPTGNTFTTENIFPAFNVLSVLKDVFEGEGFKIQGNIFELGKFKDLYQTFSYDPKKYHDEKVVPYYFDVNMSYTLRLGDNTSSTAQETTLFTDPQMRWGTDALLLSENTTYGGIDDSYGMMSVGKSGARTITIPKSGWWYIDLYSVAEYPNKNGHWDQEGRVDVCGQYNDSDRVDFSQNILEVQLKKTSTPLSDPKIFSYNMATPIVPTDINKDNVMIDNQLQVLPIGSVSVKLSYDDARNSFPKNQSAALVKDYSGFDTSEFICGFRWGCQYASTRYSSEHLENRRSNEMAFTCLPNPEKSTMVRVGDKDIYMPVYEQYGRRRDDDTYRYDYGKRTAQALVRDDSFSNFPGYNRFKPNTNGSGGTWDTSSNFGRRTYPGLNNSNAQVVTHDSEGDPWDSGVGNLYTCVWLEEGDNISIEAMMPFNDYADECGTIDCDWKHFYYAGITNTRIIMNLTMAFISTDEKYVPTNNNPMPNIHDVNSWNEWVSKRMTNVNQWLGDAKVNDWVNNLLTTFNLRLTKVNDKTYSIDTMITESNMYGNIIDIDEWVNVKDAEFKRLDTKNTTLEWTISTDEEGYVHGNNTKNEHFKKRRDMSGYTGGITFEVPSSNSETKIKSNYSYTWSKDITFRRLDSPGHWFVYEYEVPVIGDAELWENDFNTITEKDFATDKTSRLIYIDRELISGLAKTFQIYKVDTTLPSDGSSYVKKYACDMIYCHNYKTYVNNNGVQSYFRLDYDNTESSEHDETITDVFFNIKKGTQYSVEVPIILPNDVYSRIKANTLVRFNNCLFRVLGIEGHNVDMSDSATLKLITLN
jgi:hypothetical protein